MRRRAWIGRALAAAAAAGLGGAARAQPVLTEGEVRRVDREQRKLTLRHGRIEHLDMPPMTMVFRVADPALLDRVQVGDRVRFDVQSVGGALTVTAIEAVR